MGFWQATDLAGHFRIKLRVWAVWVSFTFLPNTQVLWNKMKHDQEGRMTCSFSQDTTKTTSELERSLSYGSAKPEQHVHTAGLCLKSCFCLKEIGRRLSHHDWIAQKHVLERWRPLVMGYMGNGIFKNKYVGYGKLGFPRLTNCLYLIRAFVYQKWWLRAKVLCYFANPIPSGHSPD